MKCVWRYGLPCLLALSGCSDDSGPTPQDASGLTSAELCAEKCRLQVAAGCAKTPPDYLEGCSLLCASKYDKFPECAPDIRPLDICAIERVKYSCTESAVVTASPMGACAAEGLDCVSCTGDFLNCL